MWRNLTYTALVALVLLASPSTFARERNYGSFDRLAVVQGFVDDIYPGLKSVYGLLLSRGVQFHLVRPEQAPLGGQDIDILPCRPGSGVYGGGGEPIPALPYCAGLFSSGYSEFLTISVGYADRFPIAQFRARGSFVDGKSIPTRQEIANHSEWSRQEMTGAVARAKPRYGPDQKEELSRSIPIQAIYEFTGCRLDPSTASFWVDRLEVKPDPVRVEIQWVVSGHKKNKGQPTIGCRATFEPFEGKLLTVQAQ